VWPVMLGAADLGRPQQYTTFIGILPAQHFLPVKFRTTATQSSATGTLVVNVAL
jgi:hypothetical protein